MMYRILGLLSLCGILGCGGVPSKATSSKYTVPTVFDEQYYQDLEKNIVRLHHLMQGTFTAYAKTEGEELRSWEVSEGDSVILYTVPLGVVPKHGYWLFSYEFMTSLPDAPIYTSIKHLVAVDRDTIDVYYYKTQAPLTITLADVLDAAQLINKIELDSLIKRDKRVRYVRQSASHFVGESLVYLDPDRDCWRQNHYDLSPNFYKVSSVFYDKANVRKRLRVKKRPNTLVRRAIEERTLIQIANKS